MNFKFTPEILLPGAVEADCSFKYTDHSVAESEIIVKMPENGAFVDLEPIAQLAKRAYSPSMGSFERLISTTLNNLEKEENKVSHVEQMIRIKPESLLAKALQQIKTIKQEKEKNRKLDYGSDFF